MKRTNIKISEEKYNNAVIDAMKQFDFEKVHNFMKATNWYWASLHDDGYIPSVKMLQNTVFGHFKTLWDDDQVNLSTGGFHVGIEDDVLFIAFTLEEVSIDIED